MRINKNVQYGLLFALYLCRSGRVSIKAASMSLNIPTLMLAQIANKLRVSGVIRSVRGPGGGYELTGDPTMLEVWNAVEPLYMLKADETMSYTASPDQEHRALLHYVTNLRSALLPLLKRKVRNVGNELVVSELAQLAKINEEYVN